ncbi:MAG: molecular chaperone DnaK, partial [Sphingobacteriales bacterium]
MKRKILFAGFAMLAAASGIIYAADHLDAPSLINADGTPNANDISDTYVFQSPTDNAKMVFVLNWQGLMSPART